MNLYHTKRPITSASATTEATGYPASNLALESISRPYRSTSLIQHTITLNIASATVAAVLLTDCNFASATIQNAAGVSQGTLTTYADKLTGRRRGVLVAAISATTAIKVVIPAGATTDGAAYWRSGAAHLFAVNATLPRAPSRGVQLRPIYPRVSTELPNQQIAEASTGPDLLSLSLPFTRSASEDVWELLRQARAATVGLAVSSRYPELVLPVRYRAREFNEELFEYLLSRGTVELREVT